MILYAWGANNCGQLGLGYESGQELEPREVDLSNANLKAENIVSITGGAVHTLMLDSEGHVYCCGFNSKGQLGLSGDSLEFKVIEILKGYKIAQISCGWEFSTAISQCGKLFVWGSNGHTQLGLSRSIVCTGIPSRLHISQLASGIKQVSCGLRHTAMITMNGDLLVAGTGSSGQLGLGGDFDDNYPYTISKVPNVEDIACVAAGKHHTVSLKKDGTVISWGENIHGQLGINPIVSNSYIPMEVYKNKEFDEIYAGWTHTAALTKKGDVFTWGRNTFGQLGSFRSNIHKPEKIPNLSNIAHLSLGSEHNVAVTKDDRLFTWGWNGHGICGNGNMEDVLQPTQIFPNRKVKLAFACTTSTFAIVE
ncbi:secretion-regulating guanine nucleotide exchange factor-like [Aethina tumida]|uniref:secretion-regulating guanine nucleotide exchange factor-like n=1 Tax=Aethina tumida TaxID=116153 RepID=UPI0021476467|nr:secretion-regulating guanine nucleotide exchange factor-like [Aethina tumida]